jgi:hypothetical protein
MSQPRVFTFVKGESQGGKDMKHLVRFASSFARRRVFSSLRSLAD